MKKLISGMFIGIFISLLAFNFTLYAETSGNVIKLIVNGVTLQDELQPISLDGRIYVSARSLSEALGASVSWDSNQNAVIVNSIKVETTKPVAPPVNVNPVQSDPVQDTVKNNVNVIVTEPVNSGNTNQVKETTFNGIDAIEVGGITYFSITEYSAKINADNSNNLKKIITRDLNNNSIIINGETIKTPLSQESGIIYKDRIYINVKYYIEY